MNTLQIISVSLAVACVTIGHTLRIRRIRALNYFQPQIPLSKLAFGLSAGYIFDSLWIFRLGEILRIYLSTFGNSYKIICSMASTIFIERLLDLVGIWLISCFLLLITVFMNLNYAAIAHLILILTLSLVTIFTISLIAITNRPFVRKAIYKITSGVSAQTRKYVFYFFFSLISALKNIPRLGKTKIFVITFKMWVFYLFSYICLGIALAPNEKIFANLISIWNDFYKDLNFQNFLITASHDDFSNKATILVYFFLPSILLLLYVFTQRNRNLDRRLQDTIHLLPFTKESNEVNFMEIYFSSDSTEYANSFLELNRHSIIVSDFTGGSGDITLLIEEGGTTKFRKIAGLQGNHRLDEQIERIENDVSELFCEISSENYFNGIKYYEMPFIQGAIPIWKKFHATDSYSSVALLDNLCTTISDKLHQIESVEAVEPLSLIHSYHSEKMIRNTTSVIDAAQMLGIDYNEPLIINESYFPTPFEMQNKINSHNFLKAWENDPIGIIHGDLSLENVIWQPTGERQFYLIDPSGRGKASSTYIDFSKIRLSLTFPLYLGTFLNIESIRKNEFFVLKTLSDTNGQLLNKFDERIIGGNYENEMSMKQHEFFNLLRMLRYKRDQEAMAVLLELAVRMESSLF